MKKALLVSAQIDHPGGVSCVAAWAVQALLENYRLHVLTWKPPDLDAANRRFGTTLAPHLFTSSFVPERWQLLYRWSPVPLAFLGHMLIERQARRLTREDDFDLVVGVFNEIDIGRPAVQYVHYPYAFEPRPDHDLRWYHWKPAVWLYRRLAARLISGALDRAGDNLTLANSGWTAERFIECYGAPARVVHPPVPVPLSNADWSKRSHDFVALGRFAPEKRLDSVIRILARVREAGHDVRLHLCGVADREGYFRQIQALAASHGDWIRFHLDLPRPQLIDLIERCRYGIHGMQDEHFGIAVAELMRLGCVVFAADAGGPPEILGDRRLLFADEEEATKRILDVLEDESLCRALRAHLSEQAERFSPEHFMEQLLDACREMESRTVSG